MMYTSVKESARASLDHLELKDVVKVLHLDKVQDTVLQRRYPTRVLI